METRVAALEADMRDIKGILARMEPLLRSIDERLRSVESRLDRVETQVSALALDVAELKGWVSHLPNTWQMIVGAVSFIGLTLVALRFGLPTR